MGPTPYAFRLPFAKPADVFLRMSDRPGVAWLDSSLPRSRDGQFSILAAEPRWIFVLRGDVWTVDGLAERAVLPSDGLAALEQLVAQPSVNRLPEGAGHLPFLGGAIGWLGYDLGRRFEQLPNVALDDVRAPDAHFAWYDHALVWDHAANELWAVGLKRSDDEREPGISQQAWLRGAGLPVPASATPGSAQLARSNFTQAQYLAAVEAVRAGIARGDYYQLNLVQRFTCEHPEPAPLTYLRLRERNPAPFAAYLDAENLTVLSSSPERFLEVTPDGRIRTFPIKGTRPRGPTPEEDARLRHELLTSAKENAELLMIVDLLRNDLGRVCAPGSVEVPQRRTVESFATVHHLVAEVTGQLRAKVGLTDLLRAVFPGGSITGAPKVSAMGAIERLEPHRRGIAMGSIGYLSAHGRMDLSIAIRTVVCAAGHAHVSVGAGIVWDSEPAAEYAETLAKGRALFAALGATPDTT